MGILDDAIREHLELKRQHGADSDDVERLEKEAFGPPARPGDPEFDTSEGQLVDPEAAAEVTEAPSSEAPPSPSAESPSEPAPEPEAGADAAPGGIFDAEGDESWLSSLEDVVESPPIEEQPAVEQPGAAPMEEPTSEAGVPATEEAAPDHGLPSTRPIEDESPAERARIEHPDLGDTVAHDAIPEPQEDAAPDASVEATATSAAEAAAASATGDAPVAPPEAPESAIFDQDADEDLADLDLDLDDEEPEASAAPAPAQPTDERAIEPEPTSTEMEALPAAPAPSTDEFESGTGDFEIDPEEEDELEDDDEDLLEETPDFLQDAPEGERLWFEQGAPKDFDFEDDED